MTLTALVIDDIRQNLNHFRAILMQLGCHIHLAETAEDGLKIVEHQKVDVIFLDYLLPGMNGIDFIKAYRLLPEVLPIPIIMISTNLAINQFAVNNNLAQAWLVKNATRLQVEKTLKDLDLLKP